MKYGYLLPTDDTLDRFEGELNIPGDQHVLQVTRNTHQRSDRAPTHTIYAKQGGALAPVGIAWQRTAQRGEHKGTAFLSVCIDYPGRSAPLNLACYPGDDDEWDIVWRRRAQPSVQA